MSNYIKATNFASKDALTTGNPLKTVSGTEIDDEYTAIAAAINTKADTSSPTLTGTPVSPTAAAASNSTQIATTAFTQAAIVAGVSVVTASASSNTTAITANATAITAHTTATTAAIAATDASVATTNSTVATKAPLASPALTGTPTAPTSATSSNSTQVATTAFTQAAIVSGVAAVTSSAATNASSISSTNSTVATKAPLASPALTGNPTAPTQSAGNNSTRVATTSFVGTAVSNLVDSSPAALNTLNELAAALGDDPSFATTVNTNIATKAPTASPALTGTPTAPTASVGTNTTQLATTAFVAASSPTLGVNGVNVNGTLVTGRTLYVNNSGPSGGSNGDIWFEY